MKTIIILLTVLIFSSCSKEIYQPSYYSSNYHIHGKQIERIKLDIYLCDTIMIVNNNSIIVKRITNNSFKTTFVTEYYFFDLYKRSQDIYVVDINTWETICIIPNLKQLKL